MSDNKEHKACAICNGTGVSKPNFQNIHDLGEGEELDYQPIECQHCGGSGVEPE